ncbi:MAG: hypothetical protein VKJ02_08745 [Snowella sp.]|nr:hypothetical protein [Snowella sp.]
MTTTIETDLKDVLARLDQRFDRLEQRLDKIDSDITDLKINQVRMEEKLSGQINALDERLSGQISVLDEKVTGFGKRLENQEFTNRGIFIALIKGKVRSCCNF